MDREPITGEAVVKIYKAYWPMSRRMTPELVKETVDNLNKRGWDMDDFNQSITKYREHWNWTSDERYKSTPDWGQLARLYTPKWEKERALSFQDKRQVRQIVSLPEHINRAFWMNLKNNNYGQAAQVMVDYYGRMENYDKVSRWGKIKEKWQRKDFSK